MPRNFACTARCHAWHYTGLDFVVCSKALCKAPPRCEGQSLAPGSTQPDRVSIALQPTIAQACTIRMPMGNGGGPIIYHAKKYMPMMSISSTKTMNIDSVAAISRPLLCHCVFTEITSEPTQHPPPIPNSRKMALERGIKAIQA